MLFTPCRSENALIGNCSSYQLRYMSCIEQINKQMEQYAICAEEPEDIQHNLQNNDDNEYDTIAPVTQHGDFEDESEGNID